jgi:3-methyladenine DNA glycosylase AlkD
MPSKPRTVAAKPTRKSAEQPIAERVDAALASLKRLGNKKNRDEMGSRYGIVGPSAERSFGVPMAKMLKLAKNLGQNHELAAALWDTGWYEARMLASMVDEPGRVTPAQMDRWCRDFDNWAICDTVCFKLFDRVPHAFHKVEQWSRRNDEFVKRAAFALLACLALHDKQTDDAVFADFLPLIERAATDERNFVKKGVSWALRAIGRRSLALNASAVALAQRLSVSSQAAPRWVGKDAFRELTSSAVTKRLAARPSPNPKTRAVNASAVWS